MISLLNARNPWQTAMVSSGVILRGLFSTMKEQVGCK